MRSQRRFAVIALLGALTTATLLLARVRASTPGQALARARTPRIITAEAIAIRTASSAFPAGGRALTGPVPGAAGGAEPVAGAGIGSADTWYSIEAATGVVTLGDLQTGVAFGSVDPGARVSAELSDEDDGLLFVASVGISLDAIEVHTVRTLWSAPLRPTVIGLATAGGRVFAAEPSAVHAYDTRTGRALWTHVAIGVTTGVGATRDRVCFGTADGGFHVLDATNGITVSDFRLARPPRGNVAVDGGTAFVLAGPHAGASDLPLYAIDLAWPRVKWRYAGSPVPALPVGPARASGPAAGDGVVCFSFGDWLYAVDARDGALRWRFQPAYEEGLNLWRRSSVYDPLVGQPAIHDGVVYGVASDRILGVTLEAGREVWRYEPPYFRARGRPLSAAPPRVHGNVLVGVLGQGAVVALPLDPDRLGRLTPPARSGVIRAAALAVVVGGGAVVLLSAFLLGRGRAGVALASLLLCVLTAWAWVASYAGAQFVGQQSQASAGMHNALLSRGVRSADGAVTFGWTREVWSASLRKAVAGDVTGRIGWHQIPRGGAPGLTHEARPDLGLLRFALARRGRTSGTTLGEQAEASVTVPHWVLVVVFAVLPLAWLSGRWRDRRRYPRGCCPDCGYDLRASAGACPECGRAIPVTVA